MSPRRGLGQQTVTVLKALTDGCRHGFDVVQRTGTYSATVYRSLRRLEQLGYVTSKWEAPEISEREGRPRRKYYTVTAPGRKALAEVQERYRGLAPEAT